jgi:hypothetical protein
VEDRTIMRKVWRAAHAVGAAGLLALAAMHFAALPARAACHAPAACHTTAAPQVR